MRTYEAIRNTDETDDEFATSSLFPLNEWRWFDGQEPTC